MIRYYDNAFTLPKNQRLDPKLNVNTTVSSVLQGTAIHGQMSYLTNRNKLLSLLTNRQFNGTLPSALVPWLQYQKHYLPL